MTILKFGGTSVQNAEAIRNVISIVETRKGKRIVVVSAVAGVTNKLVNIINSLNAENLHQALTYSDELLEKHLNIAKELNLKSDVFEFIKNKFIELQNLLNALDVLGEVSPKSKDMILSYGELLSSFLIYNAFLKAKKYVSLIDIRTVLKTDSNYTEANVNFKETKKNAENIINSALQQNDIIITQGFIASNAQGFTTTLGRGGSDYSASIIASVLKAEKLEIWTDVDGILTSDPRIVKETLLIRELSYTEASELAFFGAKVLHPKTIYPAVKEEIPVWVLNTFNPFKSGTKIVSKTSTKKMIKAIAFRKGTIVINISSNRMLGAYGFLSSVFEIFKKYETSVDLVTTSEVSISLTIDDTKNLDLIVKELKKFSTVEVQKKQAIISAIGEGIKNTSGIASRFFNVLKGINISMVSLGASEVNLSIVVSEKDVEKALSLLHNEFFGNLKSDDVFQKLN
ncbi:MAG: lysine-sensitive aspartokinase 3 [Candidatus Kapabacteria bacterium]|nr:lysine-sensitive aspartokinase 3 [Candidatus Kapabacteria bacterium]